MPILLVSTSLIFENNNLLSANILYIDFKPSIKSFIQIKFIYLFIYTLFNVDNLQLLQ